LNSRAERAAPLLPRCALARLREVRGYLGAQTFMEERAMQVSVRNIVAKCLNCGADDFEAIGESRYTMLARMMCTGCGSGDTLQGKPRSAAKTKRAPQAIGRLLACA